MKIVKFGVAVLALTTLIACNSETEAPAKTSGQVAITTPETQTPEAFVPQDITFEDAVKGTGFEGWANNFKATGVTSAEAINGAVLKISNIDYLMNIVHDPKPVAGDTYEFSVDMKDTEIMNAAGGGKARIMISRDCSTAAEDYSLEEFTLTRVKTTYSVSHTFKDNYDCFTYGILVHGASAEAPRTIQLSDPSIKKVN